ncbi:MAG: hypothetical protein GY765_17070, partial [bacterium]|nr:hypothetical protein [bacterium]
MDYVLEERIGEPDLFTGRKKELAYYLKWIDDIKKRKSQSSTILARRKMGKTALMERLFNITFHRNDGVIPFYYEIKETKMWMGDFCVDFFLTFIYQYIAFKSRKIDYMGPSGKNSLEEAKKAAANEGLDYLIDTIESVEHSFSNNHMDILWEKVRQVPKLLAYHRKEFIVQMIDEFQFLNSMIYLDRAKSSNQLADTMAGGYLSTAESKVAPLLVSGSWVGWLLNMLTMTLPARFRYNFLENMPENEAVEMIFKYSRFYEIPVTGETAYLIASLSEGSPFYISAILRSQYHGKDLTTISGLTDTLEFETLNPTGLIKYSWMEYVKTAFSRVNDRNAKRIVLHLFKNKDRELTRKEILQDLKLDMTDSQLETRLDALVKADIISQGKTNFDYSCVRDNIFDKVFRGVYQKEIEQFDINVIKEEYSQAFRDMKKRYLRLQGKYNHDKGYFAEYVILDQLKYGAVKKSALLKSSTHNLPADFEFCEYSRVWRYDGALEHGKEFNVDIYARSGNPVDYSIIGEVKSRDSKKFSKDEVIVFE